MMNPKILFIYFLVLLLVNGIFHWQYLSFFSRKQRCSRILIHSGVIGNSFNPSAIHLLLNSEISQSNILSIMDNNLLLFQISNPSSMTMILSNGYHHLDFLIFNPAEKIEFYQEIDLAIGNQSLLVTVLDEQYQPVGNVTVHLELVDYSHINHEHQTNQFGQVSFNHLPKQAQVYIEAISMRTKHHADIQINTQNYRNITLILKEMSIFDDTEYDSSDRGYYAI